MIIPLSLTLLLRNPVVQTLAGKIAAGAFSRVIDQKVKLESISFSIIHGLTIKGLDIYDHHDSSMLYVGKLNAIPYYTSFDLSHIAFASLSIDSVRLKMISYEGDDADNLTLMTWKLSGDGSDGGGFSMSSVRIKLTNSSYTLNNRNRSYDAGPRNMDYGNIVIDSINMNLKNFVLINDSLNFHVKQLSAREKSGLLVYNITSDFVISRNCFLTNNFDIQMNNSDVNGDFGMFYDSYGSMSSYIDSVEMKAVLKPTTIYLADLGVFSDVMYDMKDFVGITGKMTGTVKDLNATELRIKFAENTRISGDIKFVGLPDFYSSKITANNLYLTTNTYDLSKFYLPVEQKSFDFSGILNPECQVTLSGNYDGYYENFISELNIDIDNRVIKTKINYNKAVSGLLNVKINVQTDSLNIGKILKQDFLGMATMKADAKIAGYYPDNINYSISGLFKDVDLLGYNYSRISLTAGYGYDSVYADFRIGDRNLMMSGKGYANLESTPEFYLESDINSMKLNQFGLNIDDLVDIKTELNAEIIGTDINTLNAKVNLRNITAVFNDKDIYSFDSINVIKKTDSTATNITLSSDIVDAALKGDFLVTDIYDGFISVVDEYFAIENAPDSLSDSNINADLYIGMKKPELLTEQFLKGVAISKDSKLNASLNFPDKKIGMNFQTDRIQVFDTKIDSVILNIYTNSDAIVADFTLQNIILKDSTPSDSLVFGIDDLSSSAIARNDSIIFGLNWDNRIPNLRNSGEIEGFYAKVADTSRFSFDKADIYVNDVFWTIDTNNLVSQYDDRIYFRDVRINAGKSAFEIVGTIPRQNNDTLLAVFTDWDLSNFDLLTKRYGVDLDGSIVGELQLGMVNNNTTFVSNIKIDELGLNSVYLGDAHILNTWDNTNNSVFMKSQVIRKGESGVDETFLADGYYYPFRKNNNLNVNVSFNRFKLKVFEPFLNTIVNELEGTTSGKLNITGSIDNPSIVGSADMQRAGMKVVYLNTKYSFSNSLEFDQNGIKFDKLVIYDTLGNSANIDGRLTYNNFKDPYFDVSIRTPKLLFFNTKAKMNDLFYGTAIASGDIRFTGTTEKVNLGVKTRTQKGTSVTLPLNYSVEISDKDYIIFTNPVEDTLPEKDALVLSEKFRQKELEYNIAVNMSVNPDALLTIDLPVDMGKIQARGNSNLNMDVNSNGEFTMVGDYIVDEGLFHFTIGNLISKRFSLVKGGRISWSGNPYSANVSIKGLYKVKTNLSSLGITIDSTASYKNKVTVDCYIVLTGELLNPNIKFEIEIPDLDPDLQRVVFSELDTTNTAMMNQQMISLLVLGSFSFNNASNVSLQSSYYNVIANQLSSMLSQISQNVDIGLNYKPGDDVSEQEFEVALSTQLFDDRLTIDGNFGMTYDRAQQSASNIVGDVDIGYKLTPDGQWVLKVFNHSNVNSWYNYSNYDQTSPYTQGVGIAFQKDFTNIRELFSGKKKKKAKKEEEKKNITKQNGEEVINEEED